MNSIAKTTLVICFVMVAVPLLLLGGMMTSTLITEGMIIATRAMGGVEWVGLPALTMLVIGSLMIWALFGQQNLDELPSSAVRHRVW